MHPLGHTFKLFKRLWEENITSTLRLKWTQSSGGGWTGSHNADERGRIRWAWWSNSRSKLNSRTCILKTTCVCACVQFSAVLSGVIDLLGEVAAKSSYSKVLVGDWSERLSWPPWEKGMSDGLIPNSLTLHSDTSHTSAQRSRGRERRGKQSRNKKWEGIQELDRAIATVRNIQRQQ